MCVLFLFTLAKKLNAIKVILYSVRPSTIRNTWFGRGSIDFDSSYTIV